MRIRKNAKVFQLSSISAPSSSSSNPFLLKTTHLQCQLNQSPWDVITFPIPPQDDRSSPHFQVDVEDCEFARNGSYGDSIGAIESTRSMKMCMESEEMCSDDRKWADCEDNWEERKSNVGLIIKKEQKVAVEDDVALCGETNSKGWQCGRVVKNGHTRCALHLKRSEVSAGKKSDGTSTPARRGRGRPRIKKEPAKNPNEFYYYSGFGPHWGKKKSFGGTIDNVINGTDDDLGTVVKINVAKSQIDDEGIDYMECDDDEDDDDIEDEIVGKRRGRKRIKARSLKSLM